MGLAVSRQCELAGVARSSFYALSGERVEAAEDDELLRRIDEEYTRHPFYGTRRMTAYLQEQGYRVNRKRVQRLMRLLGLAGMAPGPNTSRRHPQHPVYPYLLRGGGGDTPEPGVEHGHHLHPPGAWLHLHCG